MRKTPECLQVPVIESFEEVHEGKKRTGTRIAEGYVEFLRRRTAGEYPEEMGMSMRAFEKITNRLVSAGVQVPPNGEKGMPTRMERRLLHVFDNGAKTFSQLAEALEISYESARVHVSNLSRPVEKGGKGITIPIQRLRRYSVKKV